MPDRISPEARAELKAVLALAGKTQRDVAYAAGVDDAKVSSVLSGATNSPKVFAALAAMFPEWAKRWLKSREVFVPRLKPQGRRRK
jgi:hypothetical protein